ncbi:LytR family transcriptional regulator [Blastococcus sp. TF02A-30]|nr:LytR family transcriptional regulator [Blastococcus sp. TF02A-30]
MDPRLGRPAPRRGTPTGAPRSSSGFGRALGLTVLGALLPGSALLAAGYRKAGWWLLGGFAAALAGVVWLATAGHDVALQIAVNPTVLVLVIAAATVGALAWVLVVVAGYRLLAPGTTAAGPRLIGGVVVVLLSLGIAAPAFEVVQLAAAQRDLLTNLFAAGSDADDIPAGTAADPWGDKDRVNVLLLGGDGGDGRDGVRTDTVIVASIDTETGATTTFSLPRNLQELPFPPGSPLAQVYPDGFDAGSESESLLNAVYRNGPAAHPDVLGDVADPGAEFLKQGVGEALGLPIDYHVLINLEGFSQMIDALGGITVDVNYYVPIGGEPTLGHLPHAYIAPGPDQLMGGDRALDYARGRFGLDDYQRMDRQRCVLDAIVAAADPITLLTRYQEIAATTQDIVSTDIPQAVVGRLADLALKIKDAGIRSVVFDDSVIRPAYPDYDRIRSIVGQALADPGAPGAAPAPEAPAAVQAGPGTTAVAGPVPAPTGPAPSPATAAADACAYDPVAAQEALAQGQPPTSR